MQEGLRMDGHYEIDLPNGARRRVFADGQVVTIRAATRRERETEPRRPQVRERPALSTPAPHLGNVVELRRPETYGLGTPPRPRSNPPAAVVPFERKFAWRDLAAQELLQPDDRLIQADGTQSPVPADLVGCPAGRILRVRRATRLADGEHRLLDVGEMVEHGDHWWDQVAARWRPMWTAIGQRVRHVRRHRRRLDGQLTLRADIRPAVASELELAAELGPALQ